MSRLRKSYGATLLGLSAGFFLTGCQSSHEGTTSVVSRMAVESGGATPQSAAAAAAPKVTYVREPIIVPGYEGPRVVGTRLVKVAETPDTPR